jgi:hypothetical protein
MGIVGQAVSLPYTIASAIASSSDSSRPSAHAAANVLGLMADLTYGRVFLQSASLARASDLTQSFSVKIRRI